MCGSEPRIQLDRLAVINGGLLLLVLAPQAQPDVVVKPVVVRFQLDRLPVTGVGLFQPFEMVLIHLAQSHPKEATIRPERNCGTEESNRLLLVLRAQLSRAPAQPRVDPEVVRVLKAGLA